MAKKKIKSDFIEVNDNGVVSSKADLIYNEMEKAIDSKLMELEEKAQAELEDEEMNTGRKRKKKAQTIQISYVRDNLFLTLCKYRLMSVEQIMDLSSDELLTILQNFIKLVTMIGDKINMSFNVDKETFCEYAGMTLNNFNDLLLHGTDDQKQMMERIDGYLYTKKQSASEEGELNCKAVSSGVSTRYYGHSAVQATDIGDVAQKVTEKQLITVTDKKFKEVQNLFSLTKEVTKES